MIKRLGDICTFVGGGTPSKKNPDFFNGSIPWATVRDMNVRVIKTTEHSITPDAVQQSATNIIPQGEVVISTHVGLGKVCVLGQDTAINQDLKAVIPNWGLSRRYLYYWFISKADELIANGKGATVKGVTLDFVKNLKIQVMPEREQETVSDTLDKVNRIIQLADSQVARLDQLVKSRFVEMFGDPMTNPNGWPMAMVGDHLRFLTSGSRGWAKYYADDGELFITIKNVKGGKISTNDVQHVKPPTGAEAERTRVQEGDLLISITADLGRTGIVTRDLADQGAYINQHLSCVRLDRKSVEPLFVAFYLESAAGKAQFEKKNQSAVKAGLNFEAIRSLRFYLPPLALQREFAAFVEKVDKLAFAARRRRDVAKQLYRAKIQEFFG